MPDVQRALHHIDEFQQRHRPLAFVYGVIKKFGDDNGGSLGALLTFYGFLSLFPLLLVLVTFYGGLGVGNSAQDAMNRVWAVPISVRPGFLPRLVRSLAFIGILTLAIAVTTFLNRLGTGNQDMRSYVRVFAFIFGFFFNIFLFALSFRVLTARKVSWRQLLPGAVIAAIGWEVLQAIATLFISHSLQGMSQTYGLFAVVIGLLLWIFLQARVVLYAAEVNIVYVERLWPRSLVQPPLTDADRRAFELYARTQERRRDSRATLHFQDLDETA